MATKKLQQEEANRATAAVTVTDDYAVIVADKEGLLEFFKNGDNLENLYTVIEKKAKGLVADVTTKEGRSQIKSQNSRPCLSSSTQTVRTYEKSLKRSRKKSAAP